MPPPTIRLRERGCGGLSSTSTTGITGSREKPQGLDSVPSVCSVVFVKLLHHATAATYVVTFQDPMAALFPFRALRPRPADAGRVAAVPYDVVTTEEARAQASGNPLSFLRVSRAELELPPGVHPYSEEVYERAGSNFDRLKKAAFVIEDEPSLYVYRLQSDAHEQTGIAACYSLDEYDRGVIKKHERTRRDKEDDRTRHMLTLRAQTGPVFMVPARRHRRAREIRSQPRRRCSTSAPTMCDIRWRVGGEARNRAEATALPRSRRSTSPTATIARRARRARRDIRDASITRRSETEADYTTMLGVAFPRPGADHATATARSRIWAGSRRPASRTPLAGDSRWSQAPQARRPAAPSRCTESWFCCGRRPAPACRIIRSLDVGVLQEQLLRRHPARRRRAHPRIGFVGGAGGTGARAHLVNTGAAAVAFSCVPSASPTDASRMPVRSCRKSTWFEPKLRDGLLIHLI